ncbi:MAG: hypothetical protein JWO57_2165, partial [Pseudonocardiales bacterium]|nr:hypothetical protein [Pseudonocardiales bacterium]
MSRVLAAVAVGLALVATSAAVAAPAPAPPRFVDAVVVLSSQADLAPLPHASRHTRLAAVEEALRAHADLTQRHLVGLL